jgi:hypothetical protein
MGGLKGLKQINVAESHDKSADAAKLRKEKSARKDPSKYISHHNSGSTCSKVVIEKDGKFAYIARRRADVLVASNSGYSYAKKKQWKALVRDSKEPALLEVPVVTKNK